VLFRLGYTTYLVKRGIRLFRKLKRAYNGIVKGFEYGFTALETRCLEAFLDAISPQVREVVTEQRRFSEAVIRWSKGKRVVLQYQAPGIEALPALANKGVELHVCTIKLVGKGTTIYCEIVFEFGCLIGLEFSAPPLLLDDDNFTIEWVRLVADPNSEGEPPYDSLTDALVSKPSLSLLAGSVTLEIVERPAPEIAVITFLERLSCSFPPSFLDLVSETNGFRIPGGSFSGTRARTLPWPEESLVLVAENDAETLAIAFRIGDPVVQALFVNEVEASLESRPGDFIATLVEFANLITLA